MLNCQTRDTRKLKAMTESVLDLPPPARLTRLRELASEARETAAQDGMIPYRGAFLRIAAQWERMANELEVVVGRPCQRAVYETA